MPALAGSRLNPPLHAALGSTAVLGEGREHGLLNDQRPLRNRGRQARVPAAYHSRRCLIPADGFFEWVRQGAIQQPWLVSFKDGRLMVFAGLWERWCVPENTTLPRSLRNAAPGDAVETCTVLTTQANEAMKPIHLRMPVILPERAFAPWLEGEDLPLDPCPPDDISVRPVSRWVNNAAHDDPRCIEPAESVG